MGLLNRKKQNAETSVYDKCLDLVKLSTVPTTEIDGIMEQVKSIIDELEAIGQPTDELEIVSEVLDQNDYEFINSTQAKLVEKTLKINKGGREIQLTNESISKLNIDLKLGGAILDLRDFEFNGGDLLLNVNASFSGLEVYINEDVAVHDWIENKYSGVDYCYDSVNYDSMNKLPAFETKHSITLEGRLKGSGLTFRIGHEGAYVNGMSHQGNAFQARTHNQLEAKLDSELSKIDSRAEKKRIKIKNKIERKKERLNRKSN